MISTQNLKDLPDINLLKQTCKAIAVLDAVICPEWEYRYFSYNANWNEGTGDQKEECATMRNGSGDEYLILFNQHGAIINGFAHEVAHYQVSKEDVPHEFNGFMFEEPVSSIGTSFIIWKQYSEKKWHTKHNEWNSDDLYGDGSEDLLFMLDGNPKTYQAWAEDYYEWELKSTTALSTIEQIYNGSPLTEKMVLTLNPGWEDWEQLKADLEEIAYPYTLR